MFKNKKKFFLIVLIILSLASLLWIIFTVRDKTDIEPSPTPISKFELLRTIPTNNSTDPFLPTSAVEFYFSKPIKVESLTVSSEPKVNTIIETSQDNTILYLRTEEGWQYGTLYKLTINVNSKDNQELPEKIILNFKPGTLKYSPLDEIPQ